MSPITKGEGKGTEVSFFFLYLSMSFLKSTFYFLLICRIKMRVVTMTILFFFCNYMGIRLDNLTKTGIYKRLKVV